MIKRFLKAILPISFRRFLRRTQLKMFGIEAGYKGKTNAIVFDEVYAKGVWGKDEKGDSSSGLGSHDSALIKPYIEKVVSLLEEKNIGVIVDLGCGDFNVGKHFVSYCSDYIACDVSTVILERNKKKYGIDNVQFLNLDLSKDRLPKGEIAFVRQVLQHLSNNDIKNFVTDLQNSIPYKYLLVTEHLPSDPRFKVNLDKPSGPNTRVALNSGIELHKEPFNLKAKNKSVLLEISFETNDAYAILRSTLYEF